jgi:very-short-patch-repair endonuclease
MINNIYYNDEKIVRLEKEGKFAWYITESGKRIPSAELRVPHNKIKIQCHECGDLWESSLYRGKNGLMERKYICRKCQSAGERNAFYGKKHSSDFKERLSRERKGIWGAGEKNAMFGVNVWDSYSPEKTQLIKKKISEGQTGCKNQFYGKKHSAEIVAFLSTKAKKWLTEHPGHILKMTEASLAKQYRGFKSKIEKIIDEELDRRGIKFKYSKILHRKYQYDFIIGNNILLEVQGDYWHGNPLYYGEGKRPFNDTQLFKIQQDAKKKEFAKEYGYLIFYIWETEVHDGKFGVIEQIQEVLSKEETKNE